jgi:predicted peroxiredoxin
VTWSRCWPRTIKQEDLIAHAKCAGATTFLDHAAEADVSLFT